MAPIPKRDDPSNPSSDYLAMVDDWTLIADIRAGWRAIKAAGRKYLPKYSKESDKAYALRLDSTPWRPEFVDALRNLCSKPFTKEVALQGEVAPPIKDLAEDIDGCGNSLHAFAHSTFTDGVADGLVAIYVTWPDPVSAQVETNAAGVATAAAEKKAGLRPYWVRINAKDILALYTKKVGGRDVVRHIRISECLVMQDKFAETISERIRIIEIDPATETPVFRLYEKHVDPDTKEVTWPLIQSGAISLPEIPISLYFTGERCGNYQVRPPLADLANMQMEIYRALSREDEILTYAGSPMLKATGMKPPNSTQQLISFVAGEQVLTNVPDYEMELGPKVVLFAEPGVEGAKPDFDFIQPAAANITAVSANVNDKIDHFRHLALQPTTPKSGRLLATASAIDAAKAHSAVETWANGLKDVLEQAFTFTCEWLKIAQTVEVSVHTDFGIDVEGVDEYGNLIVMNANGRLSDETLWQEGQRRGILGPQFDGAKEKTLVAANVKTRVAQMTDPKTGQLINQGGGAE
jgi:hypothetical protein